MQVESMMLIFQNVNTSFDTVGRLWRPSTLSWAGPLVCWWNSKLGNQMCKSSSAWRVCIRSKIRPLDHAANGTPLGWWQRSADLKEDKHLLFHIDVINIIYKAQQLISLQSRHYYDVSCIDYVCCRTAVPHYLARKTRNWQQIQMRDLRFSRQLRFRTRFSGLLQSRRHPLERIQFWKSKGLWNPTKTTTNLYYIKRSI